MAGRRPGEGEKAVAALAEIGGRSQFIVADVSKPEDLANLHRWPLALPSLDLRDEPLRDAGASGELRLRPGALLRAVGADVMARLDPIDICVLHGEEYTDCANASPY